MNRLKELEEIIRNDILQNERKVKNTSVTVHVLGKREHDEMIAEVLASQHKYSKFPQLKQATYLFHQCIRGGPPSKKNSKHIGCKAYMSFKKTSHPMGGNVLVVTEKDVHTGHDPESLEDSHFRDPPMKRKRVKACASVTELIGKGWIEKVIDKGSGVFRVPMEVNEEKCYTVFFPELSCSCRAGKKHLALCKHLELLMTMQEEGTVESLNELMVEEAKNMLKEEHARYSILSRENGEIKVFISAHRLSVQCSLATRSCTCPAYSITGICVHLHLASLLLPEFTMDNSSVVEEVTYSSPIAAEVPYNSPVAEVTYSSSISEEVIFNTSQNAQSYISKLRDVMHYLEASNPTQEMANLIDELHNKVKDNFVYVVAIGPEEG